MERSLIRRAGALAGALVGALAGVMDMLCMIQIKLENFISFVLTKYKIKSVFYFR